METLNLTELVLGLLTFLSGIGWIVDRRKHRQEVESLKADNRQKDMNLSKMYVDEFRNNIAEPLQREVGELRNEVNQLRYAIQRIGDCPHSASCPVYDELVKPTRLTTRQSNSELCSALAAGELRKQSERGEEQ